MSCPNQGYTGPVLPRPSMRSMRPSDTCCSIAYSSAMRTGSFVVMSVVEVETMRRSVLRGQCRQESGGAGRPERRVVVLTDREDVESDLFGVHGDRRGRLDALLLAGGDARGGIAGDVADRHDAELHRLRA